MPKDLHFEKLRGRENYSEWKRSMLAFLRTKKLAKCVAEVDTETDDEKLEETMGWLVLATESNVANHFADAESPIAIWQLLQKSFAESGIDREVSALLDLTSIKLANCATMDDYIGRTLEAWNRCTNAKVKIDDRVVALLLLGQLGPEYKPFIMGLTASGAKITVESVKSALLNLVPAAGKTDSAFFGSGGSGGHGRHDGSSKKFVKKEKPRCFGCNQLGHYRRRCPNASSDSVQAPRLTEGGGANSKQKPPNAKFANAFSALVAADSANWYIDSGASRHMTSRREILVDFAECVHPDIFIANKDRMKVVGSGTAYLDIDGVEIVVRRVLYVPTLHTNLLSVSEITKSKNTLSFDSYGCRVYNANNELIVKAKEEGGVYKIEATQIRCMMASSDDIVDWHRRLGHLGYGGMCKLKAASKGLHFTGSIESLKGCVSCSEGKSARKPFNKADAVIKTTGLLDMLHMDVCGPMETTSHGGARYFATIIDDYSRKVFVSFLTEKSAVVNAFRSFKAMAENQCGRKIKRLRSDNGTEFVNSAMADICSQSGIIHETTVPYTPQHNGIAERMNRTIIERAKCMLADSELGKQFWAEAVHHAAFLINRSLNRTVGSVTPEEIWSGKQPDFTNLKLFGRRVMVHVPKVKRRKWDNKAVEMIFVGYADTQKGFRCFDESKRRVVVSRDVDFMQPNAAKMSAKVMVDVDDDDEGDVEPSDAVGVDNTSGDIENNEDDAFDDAISDPDYQPTDAVALPRDGDLRRSERSREPIVRYNPLSYLACDREPNDPATVREALDGNNGENWKEAMRSELASLDKNGTWELVELPVERKAIKTKWVFKTKRADDGSVVRYKARLVAKGCAQKYGVDYTETYSPVVRYTSIRILIALAAQRGLRIDQMDAVTAYLQGDLDAEIYTLQPDGFNDGSGRVCKLKKAMYGLKQSGRQWNKCLDEALLSFGLAKSMLDPCVYYTKDNSLIIAIYVDDFLIFWRDAAVRDELKKKLSEKFQMKDMGQAKTCVGISIRFEDDGITIGQSTYAKEILARFGMADCKAASTPTDTSQKLSAKMVQPGDVSIDVPFQEAVGSLLFLVQGTRPDLAFAVSDVSRFNKSHGVAHWTAVKRILRYLKGTIEYRIKYKFSNEPINGFVDADWASDVDERRSCTGWLFKLAGGAVSWSCKRQKTVALSTAEAEYMAMASATQETVWLTQFLHSFKIVGGILLRGDNQSALDIAREDAFRQNTKHISIRYHFIREKVQSGAIVLDYVPTDENVADCLTKGVGVNKLQFCITAMGIYAPS